MPTPMNNLVSIIEKNKDKRALAKKIIETNPKALPVIPKLVRDTNVNGDIENDNININRTLLEDIYKRIKTIKNNNKNIIKLFPDIELSIQILVSSILSPKKMTDIQLIYKLSKSLNISSTIISKLLDEVKDYVNDNYELEEKLPEIIREALFNSGAYVYAVVPESSVDEIINTDILPSYAVEEFKNKVDYLIDRLVKPINIINLNSSEKVTLENNVSKDNFIKYIASEEIINVTDNINILRFNNIKEKVNNSIIRNSIKKGISISEESLDKVKYMDIFREKKSTISNKNIEFVKKKDETVRKSIGKPMVTKIPTESIIPVFIPGNETEHIGYFVLLDESGKPLNTEIKETAITNINSLLQQNTQSQQSPIQKAYNSLVTDVNAGVDVNELFELYKDVLEKQLYMSIKSNLYGTSAEISNKNDIYFLMFTRALSEQKTNLLYIPKEQIVYFAFHYNDIGIGKSLLENLSVLSSLRAILLFAKVMAYAKQSIDVTKVNISLDPNDPDPEKTIEQVQDSVLKLRQNFFPLGINNPVDLVNWIQRAGLQFAYENNPLIPDVKINFENANLSHTVPSSDLEEDLRKQTILALGLSPETVDNGFTPEFATTVVNNNLLLSKRIAVYQKTLSKHLNKLVNILIFNDEDLRNKLREIMLEIIPSLDEFLSEEEKKLCGEDKAKFIEYYIDHISENIIIELPKPDNTNITNLSTEFDLYKENLDKVIDCVISTEIFSEDIAGEITNHIDSIKNIYKNHLLRKWCANNNFYPEVLDIGGDNDETMENLLTEVSTYLATTMRNSDKLLKIMDEFKKAVDKDIESVTGEGSTDSSSSSSSNDDSSSSDTDTSSGDEDDLLGGLGLGGNDDLGTA